MHQEDSSSLPDSPEPTSSSQFHQRSPPVQPHQTSTMDEPQSHEAISTQSPQINLLDSGVDAIGNDLPRLSPSSSRSSSVSEAEDAIDQSTEAPHIAPSIYLALLHEFDEMPHVAQSVELNPVNETRQTPRMPELVDHASSKGYNQAPQVPAMREAPFHAPRTPGAEHTLVRGSKEPEDVPARVSTRSPSVVFAVDECIEHLLSFPPKMDISDIPISCAMPLVERLIAVVHNAQREFSREGSDKQDVEDQLVDVRGQNESQTREMNRMQTAQHVLQISLAQIQNEVGRSKAKIEDLGKEVTRLMADNERLATEVTAFKTANEGLELQVTTMKAETEQPKKDRTDTNNLKKRDIMKDTNTRLAKQITQLKKERDDLKEERDNIKEEPSRLNKALELSDLNLKGATLRVQEATTKLEEVASKLEEAKSNANSMNQHHIEKKQELQAQLIELKHRNDSLMKEMKDLQDGFEILGKRNQSITIDHTELLDKNQSLTKDNEGLREQNHSLTANSTTLHEQNRILTLDSTQILEQSKQLTTNNTELQQRVDQLQTQTDILKREVNDLKQRHAISQRDYGSLSWSARGMLEAHSKLIANEIESHGKKHAIREEIKAQFRYVCTVLQHCNARASAAKRGSDALGSAADAKHEAGGGSSLGDGPSAAKVRKISETTQPGISSPDDSTTENSSPPASPTHTGDAATQDK